MDEVFTPLSLKDLEIGALRTLFDEQVGGLEKMLSLPAVLRPSRGSGALVQLRADLEIYQKRGMDVSYATELIGRF